MKIGIAGCGYIFRAVYAPILRSLTGRVQVVAVCDPLPEGRERARKFFPDSGLYESAAALLEKEAPDAVMVLTTERLNASIAMQVLEAGVPVFLEKPPASTLAQLDLLLEKEQATGLPVYSAFNRRLTPLFRDWQAPEKVKRVRGLLARIGRRVDNFPYTSVHLVDAAQYFSGEPLGEMEVIFADNQWQIHGFLKSGVRCEMDIAPAGDRQEESLSFETEEGCWILNFPNADATQFPLGRMSFRPVGVSSGIETPGTEADRLKSMGFVDTLEDFLGRLENGTLAASVHRVARARPTIALVEQMLDAGKFGRP